MSPENQAKQREEWAKELVELNINIETLQKQLRVKARYKTSFTFMFGFNFFLIKASANTEKKTGLDSMERILRGYEGRNEKAKRFSNVSES